MEPLRLDSRITKARPSTSKVPWRLTPIDNLQSVHQLLGETPTRIHSRYQNQHVMIQPLKSGYFIVLTLKPDSNLYRAGHRLEQTAREFNQDLY
jgi:hypothetical protein